MMRRVVTIMYLAPGATLVVLGIAGIISGHAPWLAAKVGHAPIWLSVGMIVFGVLGAAPYLAVMYLRRRLRNLAAMKRTNV